MTLGPIPGDPGGPMIEALMDLDAEDWILAGAGSEDAYETAAGEVLNRDGTGGERVIMVQIPGRLNHSTEERTLRFLMSPEDALGLADNLVRSAQWLLDE